ncbi:hypothetical protein Q0Z83_060000 [Actinoplanes sichuanensis]|uniref:DUF6221 family protein n=1 Tax=Actinoplanes sichuanensis TaxID=512349 RepID=A0ABW4A7D8_9ACTN|nr:DUF6221 family protein [Actinoplanes sichuanensis]BEL07809.1 hypothetical protein Q0Z83_060000 [Actinoplanes sichuanensis]
MDDLLAFLQARLAEETLAAAGASSGPWSAWRGRPGLGPGFGDLAFGVTLPGQGAGDVAAIATRSWTDAEHIARWDPVRALALTAVLREAVDSFHGEGREGWIIMALGEALYSGHPDWQAEWCP